MYADADFEEAKKRPITPISDFLTIQGSPMMVRWMLRIIRISVSGGL